MLHAYLCTNTLKRGLLGGQIIQCDNNEQKESNNNNNDNHKGTAKCDNKNSNNNDNNKNCKIKYMSEMGTPYSKSNVWTSNAQLM